MHISTRTLIEIASASIAVAVIADAYSANARNRKAIKKMTQGLHYFADIMDRKQIPLTEFDQIALNAIADA